MHRPTIDCTSSPAGERVPALLTLDAECGAILAANAAAPAHFGLPQSLLATMTIHQLVSLSPTLVQDCLNQALANGYSRLIVPHSCAEDSPHKVEILFIKNDHSAQQRLTAIFRDVPPLDKDTVPTLLAAQGQGVRDRAETVATIRAALAEEKNRCRELERLLAEQTERHRRLTEGLSDCIYTVVVENGHAVAVRHTPPCFQVTGYPPDEHARDPERWMRIVLPEDRHLLIDNIKHIVATNQTATVEYRIRHRDDRILWVSDTLIPQFDTQGHLIGYDGVIKDITVRKEAEQQLLQSKATLAMAIDGMSDPLLLFDRDFYLVRMNLGARQYFGIEDAQAAIGHPCFTAFAGRTAPCEGCENPFSHQHGFSGIYERHGMIHPERIEQIVIDKVVDDSNAPEAYIVRIFDMTEERARERQLIQGEKLASLGLLSAGIAHEINNPNNFIFFNVPILRSYLDYLLPIVDTYMARHPEMRVFNRSYPEFREDCFKLLDNIEHGSTRINQIVGNLREFVRERGEWRLTNLKQVAEKAISICQGRLRKSITVFEVDLPDDLPLLETDPLAVEQIMVNILINAIQAADKTESRLRLAIAALPCGEIHLTISDNGCGMDPDTQKKIFDHFFTTKAVGIGTGLGLSICHRLVNELGARIEVASEPGKGSVFTVIFSTPGK